MMETQEDTPDIPTTDVVLCKWDQFLMNPSAIHPTMKRAIDGAVIHDVTSVNVMTGSDKMHGAADSCPGGLNYSKDVWVIRTDDEEALLAVRDRLITRPTLLQVGTEYYDKNEQFKVVRDDYALLFNPMEPNFIQRQLENGFDIAIEKIRRQRPFTLEFDFRNSVQSCLEKHVPAKQRSSICVTRGRIVITNHTEYCEAYRCDGNKCALICLCLPCCLLTAPCYWLFRLKTCTDFTVKMDGSIRVLPSATVAEIEESLARVSETRRALQAFEDRLRLQAGLPPSTAQQLPSGGQPPDYESLYGPGSLNSNASTFTDNSVDSNTLGKSEIVK